MKLTCVQCGKKFELTDGEIDFYRSKGLDLPKRCKSCRDKNSGKYVASYKEKSPRHLVVASVLLALDAVAFTLGIYNGNLYGVVCAIALLFVSLAFFRRGYRTVKCDCSFNDRYHYKFYDADAFIEHYVKHRADVGCSSPEDYLKSANSVIFNKNALHKALPDGDKIYFNKRNGDYVVLSHSGYIRTYYRTTYNHFLKQ